MKNQLDDFLTSRQCDEIPYEGCYSESYERARRDKMSCRSISKHSPPSDDNYDPFDLHVSFPKYDW